MNLPNQNPIPTAVEFDPYVTIIRLQDYIVDAAKLSLSTARAKS